MFEGIVRMWVRYMISSNVWSSILLAVLQGVIMRYNCTCLLSSQDHMRMSAPQGSRFFQMRLLNQMLTQKYSQLFNLTDLDTTEAFFLIIIHNDTGQDRINTTA